MLWITSNSLYSISNNNESGVQLDLAIPRLGQSWKKLYKEGLDFTSKELNLLEAIVNSPVDLLHDNPHPVRDDAVGELDDVPVLVPLGWQRGGVPQPGVPEHDLDLLVRLARVMSLQDLDLPHCPGLGPARLYPRPHALPGRGPRIALLAKR